ncbi:hypothetical protein pipiens_007286 [Culex pipiens pipiens]|uniref:Uncharacterized protein n=1 Tax=Culex pipiens pipiens TaxID=38569 RepID=A0ABD1DLX2_CULPP
MDRRLAHLERMLSGLTVTVTGMAEQQKSQLNQSQGSNGNALGNPNGSIPKEKPRLRVRRSDGENNPSKKESEKTYSGSNLRSTRGRNGIRGTQTIKDSYDTTKVTAETVNHPAL